MRPVRTIDADFFAPDETLSEHLPLLDSWLSDCNPGRPLDGVSLLMVQHQLSNQLPLLKALLDLGASPQDLWWLDIPYTSHSRLRDYASGQLGVTRDRLLAHDFRVLEHYAPYQHDRAVRLIRQIAERNPDLLLVLDDGAYVLEALACLDRRHWPRRICIVEQTTRGFIKLAHSATLRALARELPVVDVARSQPKRMLEPPFIAMSVCAALQPHLRQHFAHGLDGRCLILGYGAIGEQVASFVREHFHVSGERIAVFDPDPEAAARAARRGFGTWDREDFDTRFQLVLGCSGSASFTVGDHVYLEDGALLASASSGAVELSRQDFIELADASDSDDMWVERGTLDERDVHATLTLHLVDREVRFVNAGFPVNFNGRLTVCPTRYIQPTPTMMAAAATQAVQAARAGARGLVELSPEFESWVDREFRKLLGDHQDWLLPVPESAW